MMKRSSWLVARPLIYYLPTYNLVYIEMTGVLRNGLSRGGGPFMQKKISILAKTILSIAVSKIQVLNIL